MIKLNDIIVEDKYFPDGTSLIKLPNDYFKDWDIHSWYHIDWKYENDAELFKVYCIKRYIEDRFGKDEKVSLGLHYIPNARQDRVKNHEDVFTLKYFSEILNTMNFTRVTVLDPHSPVSEALINNIEVIGNEGIVSTTLTALGLNETSDSNFVIYYPDNGAYKKYSDKLKYPSIYGVKNRNWEDGKILGVDIMTNGIDISNKTIIIVDDIISYGGSIYHSLPQLKKLNCGKIYIIVPHVENSILNGELIKSNDVEKIFTTESLFDFSKLQDTEFKNKIVKISMDMQV